MIEVRDEEVQVGWACSAQSPDLLPDKYKKQEIKAKKQRTKSMLKAYFE